MSDNIDNTKFLFGGIFGHFIQRKYLYNLIDTKKMPNAMLFSGIDGIGKKLTAFEVAKIYFCEGKNEEAISLFGDEDLAEKKWYCNECYHCKQIENRSHPDLFYIEPDGATIKIDVLRELQEKLHLKSYTGRGKITIINELDSMQSSAANSLLKILEDTPPDTFIIGITNKHNRILTTIKSRMQRLNFSPLSDELLEEIVSHKKDLVPLPKELSFLSEGSPGIAIKLMTEDTVECYNEIVALWTEFFSSENKSTQKAIEYYSKLTREDELPFDLTLAFFRNLIWGENYKGQMAGDLQQERALVAFESFLDLKKNLSRNANIELAVDGAIYGIAN